MPSAWRIVKTAHLAGAFDGEGARLHGGRWNSPGVPMVYCGGSVSLALLEMLVHLEAARTLPSYSLIEVRFDAALVRELDRARLPAGWRRSPAPPALPALGDAWVRGGASAVLAVPSAIVDSERNYLLNPRHPDFARCRRLKPRPFGFDQRLLARTR